MFRADLHCHTTCSDGSLTPAQLVAQARVEGLSALSITDHDTVAAYEEALPFAAEAGVLLGVGVEFSCVYKGRSVHILGYAFSLDDPGIRSLCERHRLRREARNGAILQKLARLGMPIAADELEARWGAMGRLGRPHIGSLMVEKGYVPSLRAAFSTYLREGKPAFAQSDPVSPEETVARIREAGGKAFVAHPHLLPGGAWLRSLLALPFDGIECYYAQLPLDREERWLQLARARGWLISGGSDFHGAFKPHHPLGASWVDEDAFYRIFPRPTTR
jgi:predicted metal-dependent phosphoesterase TrpH